MIIKPSYLFSKSRFIVFSIMIFSLLASCGDSIGKGKYPDSPFRVQDTGLWVPNGHSDEPVWLDNQNFAFASTENMKPPGGGKETIKIFNIRSKKTRPLNIESDYIYCSRKGKVFFRKHYQPEMNVIMGEFTGIEINIIESIKVDHAAEWLDRDVDCALNKKPKVEEMPPNKPPRKRLRWGSYLEYPHDPKSKGPFMFDEGNGSAGKVMPFELPFMTGYSEYMDSYLIYKYGNKERDGFWMLDRDGNVDYVKYPSNIMDGRMEPMPLKNGLLVHYNAGVVTLTNPGQRGLYFIKGNTVYKQIIGDIHTVRVSPNGCNVIFKHARNVKEAIGDTSKQTIKYIEFCQGENKS